MFTLPNTKHHTFIPLDTWTNPGPWANLTFWPNQPFWNLKIQISHCFWLKYHICYPLIQGRTLALERFLDFGILVYMAIWIMRFWILGFGMLVYSYRTIWIFGFWIFGFGLKAKWLISINSSSGGSSGSGDGDGEFKLVTSPYETIHAVSYQLRNKHVNLKKLDSVAAEYVFSCSWIRPK